MLTKKQHQVFRFIQQYTSKNEISPSLDEIAEALGTTSRGSVLSHIKGLEQKGYISREPNRSRSFKVIHAQEAADDIGLPLVGKIAAGKPIQAFEQVERIDLNHFLNPKQSCFLLQVKGESMVGCGILEGDYVVIDPTLEARNGQIVVALVDGYEATLKRLRKEGRTVTLVPENIHMQPMTYDASRVVIQGVMVGQLRSYT